MTTCPHCTEATARTLTAAASAIRRLPPERRAGHLSGKLLEMARRVEAAARERAARERGDLVDWGDS